jgi:parallel beta-helix repeat protein
VHTRMTIAVGAIGASLAFAGPALAAPSPSMSHTRAHRSVVRARQLDRASTKPAASSATEYVSPTGSDTTMSGADNTCRLSKNPCKTIQHAINDAPATGTIKVAAGTYAEQLVITGKNLTITGAGAAKTTIEPTALATDQNDPENPGGTEAVIVTFTGTTSGGLSDLTVNGSGTSEPSDGSCDLDYVGVEFANAAGTLASDDVTGIQETSGYFGCQPGADGGVYVANNDGGPHTVTMKAIDVSNYDKDGITCASLGTTCTISGSTVTGIGPTALTGQNGIEIYQASASITGTTVSNNTYESPQYTGTGTTYYAASGILGYEADGLTLSKDVVKDNDDNIYALTNYTVLGAPRQGTWSITGNTVEDATNATGNEANSGSVPVPLDSGVGDGIDLDGPNDITVQGNTVTGNADWGIALFGTTNSAIGGIGKGLPNTVSKNAADGIYVGLDSYNSSTGTGVALATSPSTDNTITGNTANGNGQDGIFADGPDSNGDQQDSGNTFSANTLQSNIRYDAEDQSSGSGTSHTGNTWSNNKCKPANDSSPLGLCG